MAAARISRRGLLGGGVAAGLAGGFAAGRASADDTVTPAVTSYAFRGEHQAGIVTPAQDRLHFAAFDLTTDDRDEVVALLQDWTAAAERLTRGDGAGEVGPVDGAPELPPDDTGEAIGLPPSRLTITFGFGPTFFDRLALADRRPAALRRLPHFPADVLRPEISDGDLCVQACADDPQVAFHAVRNLTRIAFGRASMRWSQLGFGRTSSTSTTQDTPRNLFGFKDGTANVKAEQPEVLDAHVWVGADDDPAGGWLAGGSYLVARRISMSIETWDRQPLVDQEAIVGRTKGEGAPLGGTAEHDEPDLGAVTGLAPTIPVDAHVRVVHPSQHGGAQMLRRGYNFVDGSTPLGALDAGLFFLAFVRDPDTQFIPVQQAMASTDAMMEYLEVTGSALFAVPPGVGPGEYVGQGLLV
ncbi:iron uptake transporter deferrochelatase/peroxidase subunit [Nocardioides rubriscoriae]|uniref:iron uptake transporter deferrochelatase/peroxidase subunit n=1 Tax=Nocardioides rubriscoriae TaxID=642762 RepID=UPI001B860422|nr:iron uptake transporter deferrochelatase/peroxidase subunit [Nocardioides rubriscoriae]